MLHIQQATRRQCGRSLLEEDYCQYALDMIEERRKQRRELAPSVDSVIADDFSNDANTKL